MHNRKQSRCAPIPFAPHPRIPFPYFHIISTQLFLEKGTFLSARACMLHRQVESWNDHGIMEAISNTIRDITCVYIIAPSYLRAISMRLYPEKRREILPRFPPSSHFPGSTSRCQIEPRCRIIEAILDRIRDITCVYIFVSSHLRAISARLHPERERRGGGEDGRISAVRSVERDYEITRQSRYIRFRVILGCIYIGISAPLPLPDPPTPFLVLYSRRYTRCPDLPSRRLHRDACRTCAH